MTQQPLEKSVTIDGESLTLKSVKAIALGAKILLPKQARKKVEEGRKLVTKIASGDNPAYGINTGFGYFANTKISREELKELQLNLLKSHASGYGTPLSLEETRIAMALRLNVLTKGLTGVRFEVCEALHKLIESEIYPVIPKYGSVGASGDLAPLAHLALPLVGLGKVHYKGKIMAAKTALKQTGLEPLTLEEKEGLGLINGTQIMLAVGGSALTKAEEILDLADKICALTYEGLIGRLDALNPLIHKARNQLGQIQSARNILKELTGSYLEKTTPLNVQDPYSMRCAPQVHGASRDSITHSITIIERELNAATDNPLVFSDEGCVISGGNFHGQPIAIAFDIASMALAEIGNISERRLELLLNPSKSLLPAFLSPKDGYHSGYMAAQYLSASLVNENKILANPACTDSIPGNVGVEDHVSMGMTGARKLSQIVENVYTILAIESVAAAQAVDLRQAAPLGNGTKKTYNALRSTINTLKKDRIVAEDIEKAVPILKELA